MNNSSSNFDFLDGHDPLLVRLAGLAEHFVFEDPNTALIKLRQFVEALLSQTAAYVGLDEGLHSGLHELISELHRRQVLNGDLATICHRIRQAGNKAAHAFGGDQSEALYLTKIARQLAIWFHRTFGQDFDFKPGAYTAPEPPNQEALKQRISELEAELQTQRQQAETQHRETAQIAQAAAEERDLALELAEETEALLVAERDRWEVHLTDIRQRVQTHTPEAVQATLQRAAQAADSLDLNEADTRKLIDNQLREVGWEADSETLRWSQGTRPQKGRNMAIAEWPTNSGPADYILFGGLTPIAVVEAKRQIKHVSGAIEQAKRYSRDYVIKADETLPDGPWGAYQIPFLFSTNGRPYLHQIAEQSGIWFLDARRAVNHPRPLKGWYSPQGLTELLKQNDATADEALRTSPPDYLPLRDYQKEAVHAVESAIAEGQRTALLAMATGTGKTRACIGLLYRFLKAKRFQRILFLVDRTALGEQAVEKLNEVRLESMLRFTDIYDVKQLGDIEPDSDTRLHIATIQSMVKRLLFDDDTTLPVDRYDCIVVDECHRGYTLDREMSDTELTFRSERDYISKYRRVLEHFDGVKIGLTATPALHTTEIFGDPVYHYSYRQAVIDGWLIDHEPPYRIHTKLSEEGIVWEKGDDIQVFNTRTGQVDLYRAPDEIEIDIEDFNLKVFTENFNRVVCRELARNIDPTLPGKTLVFCTTDQHADQVVRLLKGAFEDQYGEIEDDAVQKITGQADKPLQKFRKYKNERLPSVAVTVDLLTTGIDVPEIVNIVFLRRVRSRILYEQMLGRATRLCEDLYGKGEDKETFKIYDAVALYDALEPYTSMKPVVVNPLISFAQLTAELNAAPDETARQQVLDQIISRLQRKRRHLTERLGTSFETASGMSPQDLIDTLRGMTPKAAHDFLRTKTALIALLDSPLPAKGQKVMISDHKDELRRVDRGYGTATEPGDYLEAFKIYIETHLNEIPALIVVTQRPRELTRKQLRELKAALDSAGYSETSLQTAWRDLTNQEIAATIIGFIRRQALGSPLVSYEARVTRAMQDILSSRTWTDPQRQWLDRIGRQLRMEAVMDREALNQEPFRAHGGFSRLDRIFDGELEDVLGEIQEAVWRDSA